MSSLRLCQGPVILAALLLAGCKEDDETLTHGFVKLEMRRGESQAGNPFVGTASVIATMAYEDCLKDFYDGNPDLRATGREGELIFGGEDLGGEGWLDRLCESGTAPAQASCTVTSIVQNLDMVKQISVTYAITDELENRVLLFGPLPTKETTGEASACSDPIVRVAATGAIKGKNGSGEDIWETESFSPTNAVTNQGGAITVRGAIID